MLGKRPSVRAARRRRNDGGGFSVGSGLEDGLEAVSPGEVGGRPGIAHSAAQQGETVRGDAAARRYNEDHTPNRIALLNGGTASL